ncbi:hypothetical protein VNO80_15920 [Phaseolus coccineus]|uniref:Uncharacterized protein n=1 Tax=Phaseolus coccineus TaxID=3886 RepID=A0AAN9QZM9_PHACN
MLRSQEDRRGSYLPQVRARLRFKLNIIDEEGHGEFPTLDAFDLENLTFDVNVDEDEDEDGDDDEDDDGDDDGDDGGEDIIRGLDIEI